VGEHDDGWAAVDGGKVVKTNPIKTFYQHTRWCWVFLALTSLVLQATRTVDVGVIHQLVLDDGELAITLAFDLEIILRILATLPNWRSFFNHGNNLLDLVLVFVTSIIQIPAIHHSQVYPWFTIFQLARFYRVILEVPRMKPLLVRQDISRSLGGN
jgi:voltage-dependent calcium channel